MKLVLDLNVLFSAIIRDSTTRSFLLRAEHPFYFPEPSKEKIDNYFELLVTKSDLLEQDLRMLLEALFSSIQLVSEEQLRTNWQRARQLMHHVDPEDVVFIAAALAIKDAVIWSDDKHLREQSEVRVISSDDLLGD